MSDVLLATKIHIPPLHANLVSRTRLIQRLNEGVVENRLTIISAPAGYGKSTLLGEWVSQLDIPVAWLSLERGENVPARFWKYFITALNEIPQVRLTGIGESIFHLLDSSQPTTMEVELIKLVNSLSGLEGRVILVLDDVHDITESRIHRDLVFLIDHLRRSIGGPHLVVAGRMDPPWPLARWRAHGELSEFHAADLRFDYDETVQFFYQYSPVNLSSQDVVALQDRTEGWIAGLRMVAMSLQGRLREQGVEGVTHFIQSFSSSNRFILDYLVEEVINHQPAEVRDFLLKTSILDKFTAPLCNAVTELQDCHILLQRVEQANLFIIPLDEDRIWFRYHHLFGDCLRKLLKQTQPDLMPGLHQRASQWYVDHQLISEAIHHVLTAGDVEQVNEYIAGNALAMLEHSELLGVSKEFEEIPGHIIASKPWLCVAYAWILAYTGQIQEAERCLENAENSLRTQGTSSTTDKRIHGHIETIRSYLCVLKGQMVQADEYARKALNLLPETDFTARGYATKTLALSLRQNDRLEEAGYFLLEAVKIARAAGDNHATILTLCDLGYLQHSMGQLHQAYATYLEALRLANAHRQVSGGRIPTFGYIYVLLSRLLFEWYDLDEALRLAQLGVDLCQHWGSTELLVDAYSSLARIFDALGNWSGTLEAFRNARFTARVLPECYLAMWVEPLEVILHVKHGDLEMAARWLERWDQPTGKPDQPVIWTIDVVRLNYQMAKGSFDQALLLAKDGYQSTLKSKSVHYGIFFLTCQAAILYLQHENIQAGDVLGEALRLAEPEGYIRPFVERGKPIYDLLCRTKFQGVSQEFIDRIIGAFELVTKEKVDAAQPSQKPWKNAEPLSDRELEVLRFLNSHLTTPEIAREMVVAPTTIRTHVRNIYSKLDVHGRIEAIQKAKDLGLI